MTVFLVISQIAPPAPNDDAMQVARFVWERVRAGGNGGCGIMDIMISDAGVMCDV